MSAEPVEAFPPAGKKIEDYDLTQAQLGRGSRPETLVLIEERLSTLLASEIEHLLRVRTRIQVSESRTVRWTEFVSECPTTGCFNYLELEAIGGYGFLEVQLKTLFGFLDRLFGGEGKDIDDSPRIKLSRVEERVVRRLVHLFARSLEAAWRPVVPLTVRHLRVETKASNAAVAQNGDWVLVTSFEIITNDESMGSVRLALPVALLEPYKERLASGSYENKRQRDDGWEDHFRRLVNVVPVEVIAELGRARVTVGDILGWQVGDVVRLDQASERPVQVSIAGVPKYRGDITVQFGNLAVQLKSMSTRHTPVQEKNDDI
ncbi:MAG: FliM/FliN family flagellar motor switch protein [bacterium]